MDNRELLRQCTAAINHPGLILSLTVASLVIVLRVGLSRGPLISPILNLTLSGIILPFCIWKLWLDAPYFVYGLVSAVTTYLFGIFLNSTVSKFLSSFEQ